MEEWQRLTDVNLFGVVRGTAEFTPVFDWLGYVFYPITWALQIPEPLLVAKASALGVSEMFLPAALVAVAAGVLSFLSPCVLPIVPPYLAYMTGVKVSTLRVGERSAVLPALFFMLGLSTVFLIMGYAASAFGRAFLQYQPILVTLSGIFVIVLGLHFLHVFRIPLLDREARLATGEQGGSALGAYVLGLAFAFGWTPCIGPVLGARG